MKRSLCISGAFVFFLFSAVITLSGCASTGPNHAAMEEELAHIPLGKGRVVFYRDKSILGAAIQPNIVLNGSVVGESKLGGFFYTDVSSGAVEVTSKTETTSTLTFDLHEGETLYVRSAISFGLVIGRIQLTLVDPQDARLALVGLGYTGLAPPIPVTDGVDHSPRKQSARSVTLDDLDALLPKTKNP